jgi:hypothetical protein
MTLCSGVFILTYWLHLLLVSDHYHDIKDCTDGLLLVPSIGTACCFIESLEICLITLPSVYTADPEYEWRFPVGQKPEALVNNT